MRHPYRTTAITLATVALLTGCSWSCTFNLLLTVRNADDGKPMPGVTVRLDTISYAVEQKQELDAGQQIGSTDGQGQLTHEFRISGYTPSGGPWFLKLRKEGFEPVVIDINPRKEAKKGGERNPLPVDVQMKLLPKKP